MMVVLPTASLKYVCVSENRELVKPRMPTPIIHQVHNGTQAMKGF